MANVNLEKLDRRIKWSLLVVSLLTIIVLMIAALREDVFAPWRRIRQQSAALLREKATDDLGRALAERFSVQIAQNVLPELKTVDRCITCHALIDDTRMAGQQNPFKAHPGDHLANHPPEKFGCTICHRGQGRALVFEEAKYEGHHWDYPLLPKHLTQASCGACHTQEEIAEAGGEGYVLGKNLFESRGCVGCHKLYGRGGNVGPALDGVGRKLIGELPMAHIEGPHTLPQWLKEHFENPQRVVPDSQMPLPNLTEEENDALTIYMLSLQSLDLPESLMSPRKHLEAYHAAFPPAETGEELFVRYCTACHDSGSFSRYDAFFDKFFPAVRGSSLLQLTSSHYLEENIRLGRPGTLMPGWAKDAGGLTEEEIRKIREYLQKESSDGGIPKDVVSAAQDSQYKIDGNAQHGAILFSKFCSMCHGENGEGSLGPALRNSTLQNTATDGFLYATIAYGRRNTPMSAFLGPKAGGLNESDVGDLVAHIRTYDPNKSAKDIAEEAKSQ